MEQPDLRSLRTEILAPDLTGGFLNLVTPLAALPEVSPRAAGAPCPPHRTLDIRVLPVED